MCDSDVEMIDLIIEECLGKITHEAHSGEECNCIERYENAMKALQGIRKLKTMTPPQIVDFLRKAQLPRSRQMFLEQIAKRPTQTSVPVPITERAARLIH